MNILLTGGIGDVIAIESLMTDTERESIDCIFYATRAAKACIELFTDIPTFPNLKKQSIVWEDFTKIFAFHSKRHFMDLLNARSANELRKLIKELMDKIEDYSIEIIFNQKRPYTYSSFIKYKLASIEKFNLPTNYYCICPYSINDQRVITRDYNSTDWQDTINILETRSIPGVVLNLGDDPVPTHPHIINLSNKTTIREAVEIVKNSQGYLGIDSVFTVIATKIIRPDCIFIKTHNVHCHKWKHVYFAPQQSFDFLRKTIKP